MRRLFLFVVVTMMLWGTASAAPTDCQFLTPTLSDLLGSGQYADGCFVQDKLFTDFTYSQGGAQNPSAGLVGVLFGLSPGPNPPVGDLHRITFAAFGTTWVDPFSISYTISVFNPPLQGLGIVEASLEVHGQGTIFATETLTGSLNSYLLSAIAGSPGLTGITGETELDVLLDITRLDGSLSSVGNSFTQANGEVPEPGMFLLLAGSLVPLGGVRLLRCRFSRRS